MKIKKIPEKTVRFSPVAPTNMVDSPSNVQTPKKIQVNFEDVQNKIFKLKCAKDQFLSTNCIGQVKAYIADCPHQNFCSLVFPDSLVDSKITGGLIKRIKAPHCEYFEYLTLD